MNLHAHARHAEVLVVGAGPAGMAAATAAAKQGRAVLVLDDNPGAGGQIWRDGVPVAGRGIERDITKTNIRAAFQKSGAALLCARSVVDAPRPGELRTVTNIQGEATQETFTWDRLILATGARERFLPFPGWTLPGVFGAGGLQALVKGGYRVDGKRVVVAGSGPLLLAVAVHLQQAGAGIVSVIEQASLAQLLPFTAGLWRHPAKALQGLRYRSTLLRASYKTGAWPAAVEQTSSGLAIRMTNGKRSWIEDCDLLACGFHLVPNTELAALLGCDFSGDSIAVDDRQQTSVPNVFCAGEPTGIAGLDAAIVQGEIAGMAAAGSSPISKGLSRRRAKEHAFGQNLGEAFALRPELRSLAAPGTIVCRCEDVSFEILQPYRTWTEAKLQTRCGMGPCQGRICGPSVKTLFGWKPSSVRPPLFPIPIRAFLNDSISLENKTATLQETP